MRRGGGRGRGGGGGGGRGGGGLGLSGRDWSGWRFPPPRERSVTSRTWSPSSDHRARRAAWSPRCPRGWEPQWGCILLGGGGPRSLASGAPTPLQLSWGLPVAPPRRDRSGSSPPGIGLAVAALRLPATRAARGIRQKEVGVRRVGASTPKPNLPCDPCQTQGGVPPASLFYGPRLGTGCRLPAAFLAGLDHLESWLCGALSSRDVRVLRTGPEGSRGTAFQRPGISWSVLSA